MACAVLMPSTWHRLSPSVQPSRIIFFLPVTTKNWGRPPGPRVWRRCLLQPPAGAD